MKIHFLPDWHWIVRNPGRAARRHLAVTCAIHIDTVLNVLIIQKSIKILQMTFLSGIHKDNTKQQC